MANNAKPWWQSKTVWLGVMQVTAAVAALAAASEVTDPRLAAWLLLISGCATIGVRFLTSQPLSLK